MRLIFQFKKTRYLLEFIERYSLTLPIQLHEYILIWYHESVFPEDGKISKKVSEKNSPVILKASYLAIPLGIKTQS